MFAILLVGKNINPALYTRNMGMHKMTMHEPWGTKFAVVRTPFSPAVHPCGHGGASLRRALRGCVVNLTCMLLHNSPSFSAILGTLCMSTSIPASQTPASPRKRSTCSLSTARGTLRPSVSCQAYI